MNRKTICVCLFVSILLLLVACETGEVLQKNAPIYRTLEDAVYGNNSVGSLAQLGDIYTKSTEMPGILEVHVPNQGTDVTSKPVYYIKLEPAESVMATEKEPRKPFPWGYALGIIGAILLAILSSYWLTAFQEEDVLLIDASGLYVQKQPVYLWHLLLRVQKSTDISAIAYIRFRREARMVIKPKLLELLSEAITKLNLSIFEVASQHFQIVAEVDVEELLRRLPPSIAQGLRVSGVSSLRFELGHEQDVAVSRELVASEEGQGIRALSANTGLSDVEAAEHLNRQGFNAALRDMGRSFIEGLVTMYGARGVSTSKPNRPIEMPFDSTGEDTL